MSSKPSTPLTLLALTIVALTSAPRARLEVGGAPLYLIDVLALLTLLSASNIRSWSFVGRANQIKYLVIGFIGCVAIGQLNSYLTFNALKESVYIFARYMLAISLVWTTPKIINSAADLMIVVRMALVGLTITSLITIGVSLPPTRGFVRGQILSIKYLEPTAGERADEQMDRYTEEDSGARGKSLVGNSTMTGGFLNVLWPLTFVAMNAKFLGPRFALFPLIACMVGVAGTVATYGRGAILGLVLALIGILFYGEKNARKNMILVVLGFVLVIGSLGLDSKIFNFDRVIRRTEPLFEGDFSHVSDAGRIRSFTEPIEYLFAYPESVVFGRGNTRGKVGRAAFNYHSTPAAAYHFFGLIGMITHSGVYLLSFFIAYSGSRRVGQSPFLTNCYRGMVAILLGMLPWWLLGHATASMPRGAMLYFFLVGLVVTLEKLAFQESLAGAELQNDPLMETL